MFQSLRRYLRGRARRGFIRGASRLALSLTLGLLLPMVACAYTVVLRGGRRLEIPEKFTVTRWTLTYEAAPGINVTLQMATIDIAATERANNEPSGALLKRAEQQPAVANSADGKAQRPRRELTKQDIERARREREQRAQEYERRSRELGLPSLEEIRQRNLEETKRLNEAARQFQAAEAEAETYWRSRATTLRSEIAALDAQIAYVRARLAEMPDTASLESYSFITGVAPGHRFGRPTTRFPIVTGHPGFMRGVNQTGAPLAGFAAFGGIANQGHVQFNAGLSRARFGRRGFGAPAVILYGAPSPYYDYGAERSNLLSRLHDLETTRAGLQARWRSLEEEARRAGAQPGWLRP